MLAFTPGVTLSCVTVTSKYVLEVRFKLSIT